MPDVGSDRRTRVNIRLFPRLQPRLSRWCKIISQMPDAFTFNARNHQPECKSMSAYIIAQLKFTHRELYDRYEARLADVFRKFKGRLLVADDRPQVIEGPFERDKVVVLEFPDKTA